MLAPSMRIPVTITAPELLAKNIATSPTKATVAAGPATRSFPFLSITRPRATLAALAAASTVPKITA